MRTLLLILLCSASVFAQPSFQNNHCFQVGDATTLGTAIHFEDFSVPLSNKGPNAIWDYSSTTWPAPTAPYIFQDAALSTHTTFANSDINEYATTTFGRDLFYTYSNNSDTLYLDGLYISNNYRYNPSIPYLNFPLNYLDSTYTHTKQYGNPNQPNTPTGSVTRYWKYDAFGTVKLPDGTNQNCYRIRTHQIDSTYIINFATVYEELIWFRQTDGIPVMRFLKNATLITAYYANSSSVSGIDKNNVSELKVFPNPASSALTIKTNEQEGKQMLKYAILNQLGQILTEGYSENTIDISELRSGIYFIKIDNRVLKFIKE